MIRIPSHAPNDERGTLLGTQLQSQSDNLTSWERILIVQDFGSVFYTTDIYYNHFEKWSHQLISIFFAIAVTLHGTNLSADSPKVIWPVATVLSEVRPHTAISACWEGRSASEWGYVPLCSSSSSGNEYKSWIPPSDWVTQLNLFLRKVAST